MQNRESQVERDRHSYKATKKKTEADIHGWQDVVSPNEESLKITAAIINPMDFKQYFGSVFV
jgi:hypothetical protein